MKESIYVQQVNTDKAKAAVPPHVAYRGSESQVALGPRASWSKK